ncbi:MAG: hypothetical protein ACFE9T_03165 [Promethearchaeota archaeon]
MKKYSKIGIFCLISLFAFSVLTPMAQSAVTIGDTTFPADVGKRYIWSYTYPSMASGYKYGFTADSITQGVHNTVESLIVYATVEGYVPVNNTGWITLEPSALYLAANETQDYIYFNEFALWEVFAIPTPINLVLVAAALDLAVGPDSYSIDGNTIILDFGYGDAREYTFREDGFLSVGEDYYDGELYSRIVYGGGGGDEIPFGIYFLVPTISSIAVIVIFIKKRQQKIK